MIGEGASKFELTLIGEIRCKRQIFAGESMYQNNGLIEVNIFFVVFCVLVYMLNNKQREKRTIVGCFHTYLCWFKSLGEKKKTFVLELNPIALLKIWIFRGYYCLLCHKIYKKKYAYSQLSSKNYRFSLILILSEIVIFDSISSNDNCKIRIIIWQASELATMSHHFESHTELLECISHYGWKEKIAFYSQISLQIQQNCLNISPKILEISWVYLLS
jgi:hypothetical protein